MPLRLSCTVQWWYQCQRIHCSRSLKRHWVMHSSALLQGIWATLHQSCRSASWQSSEGENGSGIIPPSFSPSDSLWVYFGLKDEPYSTQAPVTHFRQQGEEPPPRHFTLNLNGARSRQRDLLCTPVKLDKQHITGVQGPSEIRINNYTVIYDLEATEILTEYFQINPENMFRDRS